MCILCVVLVLPLPKFQERYRRTGKDSEVGDEDYHKSGLISHKE